MNNLDKYQELKHLIKSGDCLQCRGNHLSSQLIMAFSGPWSHSALIVEMAGISWVIEAVPPRVRPISLQVFLEDYPGEVWWYPLKQPVQGDIQRVCDFALHHAAVGTHYDFPGLFLNAFGRVLADGRNLWCSEFVQMGYFQGRFIDELIYGDRPSDIDRYRIFGEPTMLVKQWLPEPEGWPV